MRLFLSLALALHGLIHLLGFVVPWRLAAVKGVTASTAAFFGHVELGAAGAKLLGLGWLLAAAAFLVAAVGVWQSASWANGAVLGAALFSLLLCLAGAPASAPGLVVNALILTALGLISSGALGQARS